MLVIWCISMPALPEPSVADWWLKQHLFLPVLEAKSLRSRGQEVWLLLRPLFLACRQPPSLCVFIRSSPCVCGNGGEGGAGWGVLKFALLIGFGPIPMTSFYLNYLFKNQSPTTVTFWVPWGFSLPYMNFSLHNPAHSVQISSVAQSSLTLCNPMDCPMPGFPVHHQLPELAQTHVHQVDDAIKPSHPLSSPSPPAFNISQHQGLFK